MSDNYDDLRITADFRRLRQVELGKAPQFSSLLRVPGDSKPRYTLLRPSIGLAVALLVLSITTVILLRPYAKGGAFDSINDPLLAENAIQLSTVEEMPTDFLLDTPWPRLASLEPGPQLLDLPYEFLEELPDEP